MIDQGKVRARKLKDGSAESCPFCGSIPEMYLSSIEYDDESELYYFMTTIRCSNMCCDTSKEGYGYVEKLTYPDRFKQAIDESCIDALDKWNKRSYNNEDD